MQQSIRFVGMDDTIEIWTQEDTEKPFMDAQLFSAELEKIMGNEEQKGGDLL